MCHNYPPTCKTSTHVDTVWILMWKSIVMCIWIWVNFTLIPKFDSIRMKTSMKSTCCVKAHVHWIWMKVPFIEFVEFHYQNIAHLISLCTHTHIKNFCWPSNIFFVFSRLESAVAHSRKKNLMRFYLSKPFRKRMEQIMCGMFLKLFFCKYPSEKMLWWWWCIHKIRIGRSFEFAGSFVAVGVCYIWIVGGMASFEYLF